MKSIESFAALESFGRERLSSNFFMRDFLYSEIAAWHRLRNVPDFPDRAIRVGQQLCQRLLEPLQATFGRVHVRSGYRSPLVNGFGNEHGMSCASNESNFAGHIWDYPDEDGNYGATACIVVPWLVDHINNGGNWTDMTWWIHDHLDYSTLHFFPKLAAFNINWHEKPIRRIDSYVAPRGSLTRPGMSNHGGLHRDQYVGFPSLAHGAAPRPIEATSGNACTLVLPSSAAMSPAEDCRGRATVNGYGSGDCRGRATVNGYGSGGVVNYRAIHTRTAWRKAFNHVSVDSAIYGKDGAVGLFARRARINYETHGEPLYVLVWGNDQTSGFIVKRSAEEVAGVAVAVAPLTDLLNFEAMGTASASELERYFDKA